MAFNGGGRGPSPRLDWNRWETFWKFLQEVHPRLPVEMGHSHMQKDTPGGQGCPCAILMQDSGFLLHQVRRPI